MSHLDREPRAGRCEPPGPRGQPLARSEAETLRAEVLHLTQELEHVRESESSLRRSEERLSLALKGAGLGLWDLDNRAQRMIVDERYAAILGYTLDELDTSLETWEAMVHPEDLPNVEVRSKAHGQGLTPIYEAEYRMRSKSGEWVWVLDRGTVLERDEHGRPARTAGTHLDITERKRAEAAIAEALERFEAVFQHAPSVAIQGLDRSGRVLRWNEASRSLYGFTAERAIGLSMQTLLRMDAPARASFEAELVQMWDTGTPSEASERSLSSQDGSRRWVYSTMFPVRAHGLTLEIFCMDVDISARKKAEEERRALEAQVQQTQKLESLGVLAGGIAHDFNNLLMAILANADLALAEPSGLSTARPYVEEIERASRRAADLTRQLLAYSGKGSFDVRLLDLNEVVQDMISLLRASVVKTAVFSFSLEAGLPAIEADVAQVQQVIMNLIINASEAIDDHPGAIVVYTRSVRCDGRRLDDRVLLEPCLPGDYVCLEVSDTGCGMTEDTKRRLFDPFFTTKFTGRGLGMAAVLGIVRAHHGAICVRSRPGSGTRFHVLFPASSTEIPVRPTGETLSRAPNRGGSVLVVDDEPAVRLAAERMLARLGFQVLSAADGREALVLFAAADPKIECVLLDLTMPHMDGEETLRRLRALDPDTRVVVASGYSEQDVRSRFRGEKPQVFIQKPFSLTTLADAIDAALDQGGARTD